MTSILLWALYRSVRFWIVWLAWLLGFRSKGVTKGSAAARYQSHVYGGYTPKGSRFSDMQTKGATESGFFGTKSLFVLCLAVLTWYASSYGP
ncbi:hypothetical protein PHLGIDRAFT_144236 [Phlebiopsis gigantea 11061_1 CR5-6]|uniref:Uncharacterized protein n=1 Tax=Phlebiopsis gigantea (strain 11061_1 CR5-6) TaxID=745531 RepID=A0A0C3S8V5_PHLG1|nr:hypothetical protein PHLGIDRAFT_144236 [Phlebiopsis gigantea 11061_1 CR5-6]